MVLTTLTVLPVYLLYVGIVKYIDTSTVLDMTVYFPATVYLPLLIGMYAVCLIFGVLPAMLLLRKTPSEIMAKYDL